MKKTKLNKLQIAGLSVGVILILWMILSALGVLPNFWGWDASQTKPAWKLVMAIFLFLTSVLIVLMVNYKIEVTKGSVAAALLCFVLALGSSTGFKFTAGEIGQRVTPFDNAGKIADEKILFDYYSDFYHLDTDTALVAYIKKYGELPGRNNQNAYIRIYQQGDTVNGIPPSTAPRANENFKWHGSTDNSIYKRGNK